MTRTQGSLEVLSIRRVTAEASRWKRADNTENDNLRIVN